MNKKRLIIIGVILLCSAALLIVLLSKNNNGTTTQTSPEQQLQEGTANTTVSIEVPTENPSAGVYEIKSTPSDEKADEALYAKIASLNTALDSYYKNNSNKLLSVYGLMFSDEGDFTVSASTVAKAADIDLGQDIDDFADILYIKASDLENYEGMSVSSSSSNLLEPFTAYNSADGYIISSSKHKGGIITREQYRSLLGSYATDHGTVRNPDDEDEDYLDIAAVAATALKDGKHDIKYIACDDKYAVAVIGGLVNPDNIKEYVLTKKPGGWSIAMDITDSVYPRQEVNNTFPDMELGLLPKYTIAQFGDIKTGFDEYEQSLIKLGMITEEDLPETYSCGAGRFVYIELSSGKKLLGYVNDQNKLEFYEVKDTNQAISAMLQVHEAPPIFILRYSSE